MAGRAPPIGRHTIVRAPVGRCCSLLPLGGRVCTGLSARPFFAARHEVMLQLMRLVTHCRDTWVRRLRASARMQPPLGDRFLMDYYPRPLQGAAATAIRQEASTGAAQERSARGSAAQPPAGGGQRHLGRALPGAWGAIVPQVQKPGLGHQPLLPCRTRGACRLRGGAAVPDGPASGRTGPPSASAPGPTRWGGGAILLARPGVPRLPSPPGLGPPCVSPVHAPAPPPPPPDAGGSPPLGPRAQGLQIPKAPQT